MLFWIAYQISGRNFFQVGDNVTTRITKVNTTRIPQSLACTSVVAYLSRALLNVFVCIVFSRNQVASNWVNLRDTCVPIVVSSV
ncbi:hypothetical protein HanRHA438_Chr17g0820071 [Helianthus annuus]|nr:hypothetical protein HanRHA438_Chr17g0820071 [Helianthus annuus]